MPNQVDVQKEGCRQPAANFVGLLFPDPIEWLDYLQESYEGYLEKRIPFATQFLLSRSLPG